MNILLRIKENKENYTSTEKLIAKYILENKNEVLKYSAQILGEKTNTSAAAVIRFSKMSINILIKLYHVSFIKINVN